MTSAARQRNSRCVNPEPPRSCRRSTLPTNNTYAIRARMAYAKATSCQGVTAGNIQRRRYPPPPLPESRQTQQLNSRGIRLFDLAHYVGWRLRDMDPRVLEDGVAGDRQ